MKNWYRFGSPAASAEVAAASDVHSGSSTASDAGAVSEVRSGSLALWAPRVEPSARAALPPHYTSHPLARVPLNSSAMSYAANPRSADRSASDTSKSSSIAEPATAKWMMFESR